VFAIAGCETVNERKLSPAKQIQKLTHQNSQLTHQIEQSEAQSRQLKKQLQVLVGLEPNREPETIYDLQKVTIGKYTNFYDKDKDGKAEKLIVYIQPTDAQNDIIKAAGAVDVQLWDLNRPDGQALLGQWHVGPQELKKMWFATIITINYRLTFDVASKITASQEPLTVKVTFTDYLTGKVFREQKVIKPQ
jgi:transcription elongation GreA/GreB family factor